MTRGCVNTKKRKTILANLITVSGKRTRKCTFGDGLRAVFVIIDCFRRVGIVGTPIAIYIGMSNNNQLNGGRTMTTTLTRDAAIKAVGLKAVEAVEAENCEPTNTVGCNGACQGDQYTQWAATVGAIADGEDVTLTAYYYTTNEQDQAMADADGDGSVIDWEVDEYELD
jgi:hypothetical protein